MRQLGYVPSRTAAGQEQAPQRRGVVRGYTLWQDLEPMVMDGSVYIPDIDDIFSNDNYSVQIAMQEASPEMRRMRIDQMTAQRDISTPFVSPMVGRNKFVIGFLSGVDTRNVPEQMALDIINLVKRTVGSAGAGFHVEIDLETGRVKRDGGYPELSDRSVTRDIRQIMRTYIGRRKRRANLHLTQPMTQQAAAQGRRGSGRSVRPVRP